MKKGRWLYAGLVIIAWACLVGAGAAGAECLSRGSVFRSNCTCDATGDSVCESYADGIACRCREVSTVTDPPVVTDPPKTDPPKDEGITVLQVHGMGMQASGPVTVQHAEKIVQQDDEREIQVMCYIAKGLQKGIPEWFGELPEVCK